MVVYFVHDELYERANYLDGMVSIEIQKVELISDEEDIAEWGFKFHMNDV